MLYEVITSIQLLDSHFYPYSHPSLPVELFVFPSAGSCYTAKTFSAPEDCMRAILIFCTLALWLSPNTALAEKLYRYVDEKGQVTFTDKAT